MKWWTVSILLLLMVGLSVPFVTADEKGIITPIDGGGIIKIRTPASVEIRADPLIDLKRLIDANVTANVDVVVNGERLGNYPEGSYILDVPVTQDCLAEHPYGTVGWYYCEVGT
jgi:hypothetical protein